MRIFKGKTGLDQTFQGDFPESVGCVKCGNNCRIMFVACEGDTETNGDWIADLHKNEVGKYWVHDACAVAVYLCEKCFEPNARINQA